MTLKSIFKTSQVERIEGDSIYRLRHLQFYNKKRGPLSKMCFDIEFDCFQAPIGMDRDCVFKVLSYWLDRIYEKNDEYERESLYSVTTLNILLSDKKSGFKKLVPQKYDNTIDLFVVSQDNLKKVKKKKEYKNYFEWYIPGVTKEEVEAIYKICGLKYEDLIPSTDEKYEDEEIDFGILAVPCRHSFVVANDKVEEFKKLKSNLEAKKERERLLSRVHNITDLTNDEDVESEKVYVKKLKK